MSGKEKQVFIAGTGPRTGTTLVQRIVNAHPEAWIWGEIGGYAIGERLWAESWDSLNSFRDAFRMRDQELYKKRFHGDHLTSDWVGGMVPAYGVAQAAYIAFFRNLLKMDRIWGFKAISCFHLNLMRILFPDAKIIIMTRPPLDQYRSYRTAIDPTSPPEKAVERFRWFYQGCIDNYVEDALLLDLSEFEPEQWVKQIYALIDEPIPQEAIFAAKTKVRGPVSRPMRDIDQTIKDEIADKLNPLHDKIRRLYGRF